MKKKSIIIYMPLYLLLVFCSASAIAGNKNIEFSDKSKATTVTITDYLVGSEISSKEPRYARYYLSEARDQGKKVIYIGVKVKNNRHSKEVYVSHIKFKLVTTEGEVISAEPAMGNKLDAAINKGRMTRGGMIFTIYDDAKPKNLIFETGVHSSMHGNLTATSPNL